MLQHPDGLCHPERSEGSVNVSKATVLTYSDSSSYRPQNDIDSIEKLLAKVELIIVLWLDPSTTLRMTETA